jgi:hypothetical protein
LSEYSDQILRVDELSEGVLGGCRKAVVKVTIKKAPRYTIEGFDPGSE